ncbi:MAG: methyltransferase [Pseudomonadota bacterium]
MPVTGGSMVERWYAFRDRLLRSAGFQRWAARFPPTKWIAHRRSRELFDLCAGFVYSQVLHACVRLGLFQALQGGPQTAAELGARLGLDEAAVDRLARAAVSLRLLRRARGGRYGLGELGAALLGNPGVLAMIEHHEMLYADLQDPVALLRGDAGPGRLAAYWSYAKASSPRELDDERVAAYSTLMATSQPLIADDILDTVDLSSRRRLLDVGGGEGAFLATVAARLPDLQLTLFDLPPVAARAQARFAAAGLGDRATAVGGDFLKDSLPTGADVVSLVRVVHDHDDEAVLGLLRAVRRALPPNGLLVVAEPMADTPGAEPIGEAYFGFYLLAMGSGQPRTPAALASLLRQAGFGEPRWLRAPRPLLTRVLVAQPAPEVL